MDHTEFSDPRLVALYDTLNPLSADTTFYLEAAARLRASTIVDVGCGTGLLTCDLAKRGYTMIGVEPERAMLAVARFRPGAQQVQWIEGSASRLGPLNADLAIMTGHVAQFFLTDSDWMDALGSIRSALRPGGYLMFESRNPLARRWTRWTPALSRQEITTETSGRIAVWTEHLGSEGNQVRYAMHFLFDDSGDELVSTGTLIFRSQEEITRSLTDAGFAVQETYGDWSGGPIDATCPELIFVAARAQ